MVAFVPIAMPRMVALVAVFTPFQPALILALMPFFACLRTSCTHLESRVYAALCLALMSKLTHKAIVYVFGVCLGLILYECIGLTFDYKDILATLLSGIITTILLSKSK